MAKSSKRAIAQAQSIQSIRITPISFGRGLPYNRGKCFKTRLQRGNRNRHSCGFFTSVGFTQWAGGSIREDRAHGVVRVLNTCPPSMRQNIGRGISQSHNGVNTMKNTPKSQKSPASIQHAQIIDGTTALEQPTPDTLTLEQALERTFEKVQLFAAYVYINGGVDRDDMTRGAPRFVGHYTDREEAEKAGLQALAHIEGAACCEVKDVSDTAWKLTMEGEDDQGWVTGMSFYLPTEQRALEYAQELFDKPRYGVKFKTARIKNLKLDFFAGVAQPPKHYLTNYVAQDEHKGGEA